MVLINSEMYNHHHFLILEQSHDPQICINSHSPLSLPTLQPLATIFFVYEFVIYFVGLWLCLFWIFHINGIIQYVIFYN